MPPNRAPPQEVSLAFLLNSVWISQEVPQTTSDLDSSVLLRRGSIRRSAEVTLGETKRSSTPAPLARYHVAPEGIGGSDSQQVFRGDHRSALTVLVSYNPLFLNNDELFASPMTTTLTPPGYRVSLHHFTHWHTYTYTLIGKVLKHNMTNFKYTSLYPRRCPS